MKAGNFLTLRLLAVMLFLMEGAAEGRHLQGIGT
jgi:hypothetical protein